MSEHLQNPESYFQRRLTASELLAMDDHLMDCDECRGLFLQQAPIANALQTANQALRATLREPIDKEPGHPAREHMTAYLNDLLDEIDREIFEGHLEFCAMCNFSLEGLRREFSPDTPPVPDDPLPTPQPGHRPATPSLWEKMKAAFPRPVPRFGWETTAAVAMALLLTTLIVRWMRNGADQNPIVAVNSPTPSVTTSPSTSPTDTAPPASSTTLVAINAGGSRITIDDAGRTAGMESLPQPMQRMIVEALTTGTLKAPRLKEDFPKGSGTMMGGGNDETFKLIGPMNKVILGNRPTLRWERLGGAQSYTVRVLSPGENFRRVADSPALNELQWMVDPPLAHGKVYEWFVTASKDGADIKAPRPDQPQARFRVIDRSLAGEIAEAKKNNPGHHLVLGLLYARGGLFDESERELRLLSAENPDSEQARKLLRDLRKKKLALAAAN